jgi:cation:H+ antiporter
MVLPNALLALYYGAHRRMDVVYSSQVGDAHICIPLCVGLFAVLHPFVVGDFLLRSLFILMGLFCSHLIFIMIIPRYSRVFAALFVLVFCVFVWLGLFV